MLFSPSRSCSTRVVGLAAAAGAAAGFAGAAAGLAAFAAAAGDGAHAHTSARAAAIATGARIRFKAILTSDFMLFLQCGVLCGAPANAQARVAESRRPGNPVASPRPGPHLRHSLWVRTTLGRRPFAGGSTRCCYFFFLSGAAAAGAIGV